MSWLDGDMYTLLLSYVTRLHPFFCLTKSYMITDLLQIFSALQETSAKGSYANVLIYVRDILPSTPVAARTGIADDEWINATNPRITKTPEQLFDIIKRVEINLIARPILRTERVRHLETILTMPHMSAKTKRFITLVLNYERYNLGVITASSAELLERSRRAIAESDLYKRLAEEAQEEARILEQQALRQQTVEQRARSVAARTAASPTTPRAASPSRRRGPGVPLAISGLYEAVRAAKSQSKSSSGSNSSPGVVDYSGINTKTKRGPRDQRGKRHRSPNS